MISPGDWPLGLARLAGALDRDLQRASRAAGGPRALWAAPPDSLRRLLRLDGERLAQAVAERARFDGPAIRRWLAESHTVHIGRADPRFPSRLTEIHDPPFGLFLRGDVPGAVARLVEGPVVAIVGSRRASAQGLRFARTMARDLAGRGAVVISGLAVGIDAAAHEGALDAGGVTAAVLGTGLDVPYPRRNVGLARRIESGRGLLATEHWPGTPPAPWRFPARNRIVVGLAQAVVVVEAGRRSGALITADLALESGRPVLAVPGFPGIEGSAGCNALIRAGAALCEGAQDVVAEVAYASWQQGPVGVAAAKPAGLAGRIYRRLCLEPLRLDQIAEAVDSEPGPVAAALALLEVEGQVLRGEGQRFWATPQQGAA